MCGIVGILARNGAVASDLLERATLSLAHRGPDDSGTVVISEHLPEQVKVGLGNRRLAVLDLSPLGHQPMHDRKTGNWIVYNGEIYNFREIRQRLEREGVPFHSQSDTEVLLKAYGCWGEACLHELRGMFAFAIWDAKRRRLFLARDPMGVKPLYYGSFGSYFLFASEVRTLLGTGLVPRHLDRAGLQNYLAFGSVYDPYTLVEGISALCAGHYLVWDKGSVHEEMYWDLTRREQDTHDLAGLHVSKTERNKLETSLHAELAASVGMQTVSDVPVGLFLSGGIDSSSLAALLTGAGKHLNTFSVVFDEAEYNEAAYSRLVARTFKTDHHEILVSQQDAIDAIPGALQALDQPTIDGLNTYLVAQKTREMGIKVALSGLGGDEIFAGYSSFRDVPRMERFVQLWQHMPRTARRTVTGAYSWLAPGSQRNGKFSELASANGHLLHPYFLSRALFTYPQRRALFASDDRASFDRSQAALKNSLQRTRHLDPINRVSYLESRCYLLNTLLRDSDAMSMAHGLELRVPLIDHRLAEKMFALPGSWKLNSTTPKPLLVGALNGTLPDLIVRRRKRGFTLPFEHWLRDELRPEVEETLRRIPNGPLAGLLKSDSTLQVWREFLAGRTSWSRPWSLCVLERWAELHSVTA
jgi:asparagine synthase (glutamine-hydrolysing)